MLYISNLDFILVFDLYNAWGSGTFYVLLNPCFHFRIRQFVLTQVLLLLVYYCRISWFELFGIDVILLFVAQDHSSFSARK